MFRVLRALFAQTAWRVCAIACIDIGLYSFLLEVNKEGLGFPVHSVHSSYCFIISALCVCLIE